RWCYGELFAVVNRIAHVLIEDLGVVPGNRVLLRSPNTPLLAACWLAVVKAGGVVVCTLPMLRRRELAYIAEKARVGLALTDARLAAECEEAMGETARIVHFQSLEALTRGKPAGFFPCD